MQTEPPETKPESPMTPVDATIRIPKSTHEKFQETSDLINKLYPDITIPAEDLIAFHLIEANADDFPRELAIKFLELVKDCQ